MYITDLNIILELEGKLAKIPPFGYFYRPDVISGGRVGGGGVTNCLFYQICRKNGLWIEMQHATEQGK